MHTIKAEKNVYHFNWKKISKKLFKNKSICTISFISKLG